MLFGKITPTAKIGIQQDPFNVTIAEALFMTAIAQVYKLGQSVTYFEVIFGNFNEVVNDPELPAQPPFTRMLTVTVELTAEELVNWGSDDTVVLEIIANKLGVEILEVINDEDIFAV